LAYETNMQNLLTLGYANFGSTAEQIALSKATRELRLNSKVQGKYVYLDGTYMDSLDTTALAAISLGTTATGDTEIVEAFDSSSFIDTTNSSNYTYASTATVTGETLTASSDYLTYTVANTPLSGYTVYQNGTAITSGFTVSGTSVVFTTALTSSDVITMDYSYTLGNPTLGATDTTATCTIISNAFTVTTDNYVVMKVGTETLGTGSISYYVSRDAGTTYRQIYPSKGRILVGEPTGTSFVFKIVITGDATLSGGIGFGLR